MANRGEPNTVRVIADELKPWSNALSLLEDLLRLICCILKRLFLSTAPTVSDHSIRSEVRSLNLVALWLPK